MEKLQEAKNLPKILYNYFSRAVNKGYVLGEKIKKHPKIIAYSLFTALQLAPVTGWNIADRIMGPPVGDTLEFTLLNPVSYVFGMGSVYLGSNAALPIAANLLVNNLLYVGLFYGIPKVISKLRK